MSEKVVATNRKAYHDYFVEKSWEAGIALTGTEIKSVRLGRVNLRDSFVKVEQGQAWLWNVHVSPYEHGSRYNVNPTRPRKLLLHKDEIQRLAQKLQGRNLTLVPLRIYIKGNRAKVEVALAKGKRQYDKREAIAERDAQREIEREMKERERG
ncbi:MAG: SsrA-binding protein SmpB [Chloroflexota bacterium]